MTTDPGLRGTLLTTRFRDGLKGPVSSIGVALVTVLAVGAYSGGPDFITNSNFSIILNYVGVPLIIAAFASFGLLAGVVDLSIGSMLGLSAAVCASLINQEWPIGVSALVALCACLIFGAVNALAVVIFGANTIIATLGMLVALRGVTALICGPSGVISAFNPNFFAFTNWGYGPFSILFIIGLIATVIAATAVKATRFGRHFIAVGGDGRAASRAGISILRVRFVALLMSALGAGIGGVLYVGQLGSASYLNGRGLEFQIYSAMMIGGFSIMRGGIGNPIGGALGLVTIAATANILDLKGINPHFGNIVFGLLLLAAVAFDRIKGGEIYE
ncbi:ABC transporter permease [Mesorhizobium opportunistum]|uniref:ABC transporter permease n=1 Tax=Mesorhizobium opportunistum TaxID=593909 RepID=UPI00333B275D